MNQVKNTWMRKAALSLGSILLACGLAFTLAPMSAWAGVTDPQDPTYNKVKVVKTYDSTITFKGSITMPDSSIRYYGGSESGVTTQYNVDLSSPEGQAILKAKKAAFDEFFAPADEITSENETDNVTYSSRNVVDTNNGQALVVGDIDDLVHAYVASGNVSETLDVTVHETYTFVRTAVQNAPGAPAAEVVKLTKGDGSTWTEGSSAGLQFVSSQAYNMFAGVSIDGALIDAANYEVIEGSTVVTLKPEYLATLSEGSHDLSINTWKVKNDPTGGFIEAHGTFTIKAAATSDDNGDADDKTGTNDEKTSPKTGAQTAPLAATTLVFAIGALAAGACIFRIRKEGVK